FFICVAFSIVEENSMGQKRCQKTIDAAIFCQISNCRTHCYSQQNGVGKCFDDPKVPGISNCGCTLQSPLLKIY
ncbi:unnamed protein product, partial [Brassica oleracea var. botrytis]